MEQEQERGITINLRCRTNTSLAAPGIARRGRNIRTPQYRDEHLTRPGHVDLPLEVGGASLGFLMACGDSLFLHANPVLTQTETVLLRPTLTRFRRISFLLTKWTKSSLLLQLDVK